LAELAREISNDVHIKPPTTMKPIAFCHIPKTGGTSVHKLIAQWFPKESVTENIDSENYSTAIKAWSRFDVVIGHFWFRPGEALDPGRNNITILRDPIDRVLSHFFFFRQLQLTRHASVPERSLDLTEYVSSDLPSVRANVCNFQTRLLAPLGMPPNNPNPTENQLLEAAVRAVDLFDLVGVYPELDDAAACIASMVRVPMNGDLPRENVSVGRMSVAEIPDSVREQLERLNVLDRELYAHAERRFKHTRRRLMIACANALATVQGPSAKDGSGVSRFVDETVSLSHASPISGVPAVFSRVRFGNRDIEIVRVSIEGDISLGSGALLSGENVYVTVGIRAHVPTDDLTVGLHIHDSANRMVFGTNTWALGSRIVAAAESEFSVQFTFRNEIGIGRYSVGTTLHTGRSHLECCFDWYDDSAQMNVVGVIGYHFEGMTRLSPAASVEPLAGQPPVLGRQPTHCSIAQVGRHNPIVRHVEGRIQPCDQIDTIRAGDVISMEVELENRCDQALESLGLRPLRVCYRWLDPAGAMILEEGLRTDLGIDLRVGEVRRAWMTIATPPSFRGPAILRLVPVQENVGWFDQIGTFYQDLPVLISD
jgi:Wzt C-terminal domain/Sulfotransferase family